MTEARLHPESQCEFRLLGYLRVRTNFPIEWDFEYGDDKRGDGFGGPVPDDATTIGISLELGDGNPPVWTTTLTDMIEDFIADSGDDAGKISGVHIAATEKLRDGLRRLADRLDFAMRADA